MEFFVVVVWVGLALYSASLSEKKGNGFWLQLLASILLSPLIGLIIAVMLSPNPWRIEQQILAEGYLKKCPTCAELVKAEAVVCQYCRTNFEAATG
jgi:predicted permease